jgi:hypothetical protein
VSMMGGLARRKPTTTAGIPSRNDWAQNRSSFCSNRRTWPACIGWTAVLSSTALVSEPSKEPAWKASQPLADKGAAGVGRARTIEAIDLPAEYHAHAVESGLNDRAPFLVEVNVAAPPWRTSRSCLARDRIEWFCRVRLERKTVVRHALALGIHLAARTSISSVNNGRGKGCFKALYLPRRTLVLLEVDVAIEDLGAQPGRRGRSQRRPSVHQRTRTTHSSDSSSYGAVSSLVIVPRKLTKPSSKKQKGSRMLVAGHD